MKDALQLYILQTWITDALQLYILQTWITMYVKSFIETLVNLTETKIKKHNCAEIQACT